MGVKFRKTKRNKFLEYRSNIHPYNGLYTKTFGRRIAIDVLKFPKKV